MRLFEEIIPVTITLFLLVLVLNLLASCSQSEANAIQAQNPVPNITDDSAPLVWGLWDISISSDGIAEVAPMHSAEFSLNVAGILLPPDLGLGVVDISPGPGFTDYTVDVGITHTFTNNTNFTGFDVCGVLIGNGDTMHPADPDLLYGGPGELQLLNADGYTRWMNAPEFGGWDMGFFGYVDETAGTPGFEPDATLNPYKYYCDGLGAKADVYDYLIANPAQRGLFTEGNTNVRRYIIRDPNTSIQFQYAILARWAFPATFPDPPTDIPGDFPPQANAPEAVALSVVWSDSDMWSDGINGGGSFMVEFSVFNWNAEPVGEEMQNYSIRLSCDEWTDPVFPSMTVASSGVNYCTYIKGTGVTPTAFGPVTIWFDIIQASDTYANPFGKQGGADDEHIIASFTHESFVSDASGPADFWEPPTDHDPRFLFIHHSCGSGFLFTGGMWTMLENAGFEVHDRTYGDGWVGDNTNPNHWPTTFTTYYDDMINWELEPGQYYDIVAFKSCYPACNISSDDMLSDYYGYYATVKSVTELHPETLFIPWSPPPLNPTSTNADNAARARTFANWLMSPYCDDEFNMRSFDCFNVLAGSNPVNPDFNMLRSDYQDGGDSHPNTAGDTAVATAFTAWLTDLIWD